MRRKELQRLTHYAERDLAYERTGLSRGWLKKMPCPCGASENTSIRIARDPRPEANGAILEISWECETCRTKRVSPKAPTLIAATDEDAAVTTHSEQERADDIHQYRREHIDRWIAALKPEVRTQVQAAAARMRNPAIPQTMWANSMLARDAKIKAYRTFIDCFPDQEA